MFSLMVKASVKLQPSSLWWPEHCKDDDKMGLHRQQADVFKTLKGLSSYLLDLLLF